MIQATLAHSGQQPASDVVPLQRAAIAGVAAMLARAFEHDPMFTYIFPDPASRLRLLRRFFGPGLRYGATYGVVHTTSELLGSALWLKPEHPDITLRGMLSSGMALLPLTLGIGAFRRFNTFVSYGDMLHKQAISEPHWCLLNLGVEPAHQGRGIGGALLQPVLARADAEGRACYLETNSESNVRFYGRHGFELAQHGQVPAGGPEFWAMLRPPRS